MGRQKVQERQEKKGTKMRGPKKSKSDKRRVRRGTPKDQGEAISKNNNRKGTQRKVEGEGRRRQMTKINN